MNEQFISDNFCDAEISQMLKEVGFSEPCLGVYYYEEDESKWLCLITKSHLGPDTKTNLEVQKGNIAAPTYWQAIQWLDSKGLHIYIRPEFYTTGINWNWQIWWYIPTDKWAKPIKGMHDFMAGTGLYGDNNEYPERIDAVKAAIKEAIAILKQQNT